MFLVGWLVGDADVGPCNCLSQTLHAFLFLFFALVLVADGELKEEFGDLGKLVMIMQPLLVKGNLQVTTQNNKQYYGWVDAAKAEKLRGLTDDQKHAYQIIAEHGNRGIHMRDLKFKSSQSLPELKLTLKKLKTKQVGVGVGVGVVVNSQCLVFVARGSRSPHCCFDRSVCLVPCIAGWDFCLGIDM